jgi:signal transduction histidine kinase
MQEESGQRSVPQAEEELQAWRERTLRTILAAIIVAGIVPLSLTLYRAYLTPHHRPAALIAVCCYLLVALVLVPRRLPHRVRAWGMLLGGYVLAVMTLLTGGMIGNGRLVLVAIPVAAIVLIKERAGAIATMLSLLVYVAYTVAASQGAFRDWMVNPQPSMPTFTWIFELVSFTAMIVVFTLHVALIVRVQGRLLTRVEGTAQALEMARARVSTARDQERRAVAGRLHDGPVQDLIALSYQLSDCRDRSPEPGLAQALEATVREARRIMRAVREACSRLRSGGLETIGLGAAIAQCASRLMEKTGIAVHLDVSESELKPAEPSAVVLLSVVREALQNAVKHSGAQEAWVRLRWDEKGYELRVRDQGRGFATPKRIDELEMEGHYGLALMKERVEKAGGHLKLRSAPGEGTEIHVFGEWAVEGPAAAVGTAPGTA